MNETGIATLYWLHAISPVHVGSGRGSGFIDLPVMREKVTNWPVIPGSTVKGVLRSHFDETADQRLLQAAFGRADGEDTIAGSLVLGDARLVALPVRSLYGTFAYCTSALALARLDRDLDGCSAARPALPQPAQEALACTHTALQAEGRIYLEDLDLQVATSGPVDDWARFLAERVFAGRSAWQRLFVERFVVLPDETFDFLTETATEVSARVQLDDNKTATEGALWYEESLPAESLLCGVAWCDRVYGRNQPAASVLMEAFCQAELALQVGGKASVGKGQVRCLFGTGA